MATPKSKTFDAVEMSRRLREETGRKLAGLIREERLELLNSHLRPSAADASVGQGNLDSSMVREVPPTDEGCPPS